MKLQASHALLRQHCHLAGDYTDILSPVRYLFFQPARRRFPERYFIVEQFLVISGLGQMQYYVAPNCLIATQYQLQNQTRIDPAAIMGASLLAVINFHIHRSALSSFWAVF